MTLCAGCATGGATSPRSLPADREYELRAAAREGSGPFLYVGGGNLAMFALGSSKPLRSVKVSDYVSAAQLALDLHGHVCFANGDPSYERLNEYDARTLALEGSVYGQGDFLALIADRSGYLYASSGGAGVAVYAPGCTQIVNMIRRGAGGAGPIVFDHSGNLYIGNNVVKFSVSVQAPTKRPGHMKLVRTIRDGINYPLSLAIGPSDQLYVGNQPNHSRGYVGVYSSGGSTPTLKITDRIKGPAAMVVDSKGRLYVANIPAYAGPDRPGWISVYAPGASKPERVVNLRYPAALALDPSDKLYVLNIAKQRAVLVYSPGATKLLLTITAGLEGPTGLVIGSP